MKNSSETKSILFKVWRYPLLSETFITAQIITAIECGFRVRILVEDFCDIDDSKQEELFAKYSIREKVILEDYNIPKGKTERLLKGGMLLILNFFNIPKLFQFLRRHKKWRLQDVYEFNFFKKFNTFDIIHVQYGTNSKPLDILKKIDFLTSKLVISFHGHDLYFPINGKIHNNGYYDILFEAADLLVVNTDYLKEVLKRLNAPVNKVVSIPVSVNTEFFQPSERINTGRTEIVHLLSVGRLVKFKGHRYGIQCVKLLKEKKVPVRLTIVGDGSEMSNLKKLIEEYHLEDCVVLTGKKSQAEIRDTMGESDIFLMTSVTDPDYGAESQGLVTAEAQACGLPVIAFNSGGVKHTLSDGKSGFLVPEGDVEAMVEKIEKLISFPELRQSMGNNARELIEGNFSHKVINKTWCTIYNDLIRN